ncbi:hypothetical protein ABZ820_21115 [Streptomyces diacarni]|uniref:Uncharacterized protein n=1 Tax=Streptomyces diacarni TaxID=2800381 RepID=A0A367EC32_9ACTN|nr:hypothetical protein [Streptomyces diacarni]RCG15618.1 hypothetical protein DTL70_30150 [Streptomyces diacarni]
MFEKGRRRRAARRVQPGDGRPLQRFRWWHLPGRALFHLPLTQDDGRRTMYAIDVRHWQNQSSGNVKAHLYLDGRLHAESRIPAGFPVPGGTIEVAMSGFGIKRCHYVTAQGVEQQLAPHPASAEGRRARLDRDHPALSHWIGLCSLILLLIGAGLLVLQIAEPLSRIPPIASRLGNFESPVRLPLWLNITLGAGAALGSMERALRLRYNWLLDGAAN